MNFNNKLNDLNKRITALEAVILKKIGGKNIV